MCGYVVLRIREEWRSNGDGDDFLNVVWDLVLKICWDYNGTILLLYELYEYGYF